MRRNKKGALIYIDLYKNEAINNAIVENYPIITAVFNEIEIPFIYLPKLLTDDHINKVMMYNRPYLKNLSQTHSEKLYDVISQNLKLTGDGPTLLYLTDNEDDTLQFEVASAEVLTSPERLALFASEIRDKIELIKDDREQIRFRSVDDYSRTLFDESQSESFDSIIYDSVTPSRKERLSHKSIQRARKKKTADDLFEEQAFKIPNDLRKKIEELSEAGYLSHLIKYLEILQQTTRKLSRLKITREYKIYLMDYEMTEIEMSPLPKALYLLFLNHPKGISFKELPDYREELLTIYKNISLRENPLKVRISIQKLTDPFDNSVHEKCSRIRAAFLKVVAEDIAENYFITGGRGEAKKVLLDRELVIYDK